MRLNTSSSWSAVFVLKVGNPRDHLWFCWSNEMIIDGTKPSWRCFSQNYHLLFIDLSCIMSFSSRCFFPLIMCPRLSACRSFMRVHTSTFVIFLLNTGQAQIFNRWIVRVYGCFCKNYLHSLFWMKQWTYHSKVIVFSIQ